MEQQAITRRGRHSRASIHKRLEDEVSELRTRMGGLPRPDEAEDIWTAIWYQEAHNSTALEGNTLVLHEVEALLSEGRVVGQKQLRDYMEVKGYADAAHWIYNQAAAPGDWKPEKLLSLAEVRECHRRALTAAWNVDPPSQASETESPGNWRQHAIQPFAGGMHPPSHTDVQALMTDWVVDMNAILSDPAPIAEAMARRHADFERIHPFLDGNGRTGRLLMNLVFVRLGYPPSIIYKRERPRYLKALRKADQDDVGPLGELLARTVLDNLMRFILPAVAGPAKIVPLEALATTELSVIALRNAAERGRLRAVRTTAGIWQSSKQWVNAYKASRYKPLHKKHSPKLSAG